MDRTARVAWSGYKIPNHLLSPSVAPGGCKDLGHSLHSTHGSGCSQKPFLKSNLSACCSESRLCYSADKVSCGSLVPENKGTRAGPWTVEDSEVMAVCRLPSMPQHLQHVLASSASSACLSILLSHASSNFFLLVVPGTEPRALRFFTECSLTKYLSQFS